MNFVIFRDCDTWRLRKVVIVMADAGGQLIDRTRMFAGPLFIWRLGRRTARMRKRGMVMKAAALVASK